MILKQLELSEKLSDKCLSEEAIAAGPLLVSDCPQSFAALPKFTEIVRLFQSVQLQAYFELPKVESKNLNSYLFHMCNIKNCSK